MLARVDEQRSRRADQAARPMSPSPPPTPAASPSQMKTKLETMLAYPFDCTLTFEAYEQVGATATAPPACWP